jgi:predicted deacylase
VPSLDELRAFVRLHLRQRAYDYPAPDEDLGVVSLGYEPDSFERAVRALADRYDIAEAARLTYLDTTRTMLSVSSRTPKPGARLLVISGVHGNEQAGIVAVPEILHRYDAPSVALRILTPVNPVGAAERSRFNGDGYDINRDFLQFRTEEARVVRDVFDDFRPDFVLSLHEGPQDAAFIFANACVDVALAQRLLAGLERAGTTLATKDYFGLPLRPPGLSSSSPFQRTVLRAWEATLKMQAVNAFAAARGIPEITLETGWRGADRDARVRAHVDLTLALASELGNPNEISTKDQQGR